MKTRSHPRMHEPRLSDRTIIPHECRPAFWYLDTSASTTFIHPNPNNLIMTDAPGLFSEATELLGLGRLDEAQSQRALIVRKMVHSSDTERTNSQSAQYQLRV